MRFLVVDTGIGFEVARELARSGHQVFYWAGNPAGIVSVLEYANGEGFKDLGIQKVDSYLGFVDSVDYIVVTDVGFAGDVEWLRSKGYKVFGSGLTEFFEESRVWGMEVAERCGIKVPRCKVFGNIFEVKEFLRKCKWKKVAVKISRLRGSFETFYGNVEDAFIFVSRIQEKLRVFNGVTDFIVVEGVEGIEVAVTGFFNGEDWMDKVFVNFEHLYGGAGFWEGVMFSDIFVNTLGKLTEELRGLDFRGVIDVNCIFDGRDYWFVEFTCRFGYPVSRLYNSMIYDFGMFVRDICEGSSRVIKLKENSVCGAYCNYFGSSVYPEERVDWILMPAGSGHIENIKYDAVFRRKNGRLVALNLFERVFSWIETSGNLAEIGKVMVRAVKGIEGLDIGFGWYSSDWVEDVLERVRSYFEGVERYWKVGRYLRQCERELKASLLR